MKLLFASLLFFSTIVFSQTQTDITSRLTTPSEVQPAVQSAMELANECFGLKSKPFSSYQKFYFRQDGLAYGLKNGQEVKLKFDESLKKLNEDGSIDFVGSLQNFKTANGISPEVCVISSTITPGAPSKPSPTACNTLSEIDSVVLAMSWQPAFCEEKPDKPECKLAQFIAPDTFQAENFTLHGLWPNKNSCGQNYGFCGDVKKSESNFCNYPEVIISSQSVEKDLASVMPSKAAGSCLERHEWNKHGTCQPLDSSAYFNRAITLLKDFNQSKAGLLVRVFVNKSNLKKTELLQSLDDSFGPGASSRFIIVCKGDKLTEIQINLMATTLDAKTDESNLTIQNLINKSANGYIRGCKDLISIDKIGPG